MSETPSSLQTALSQNWTNMSIWLTGATGLTQDTLNQGVGPQATITSNPTLTVCSTLDPISVSPDSGGQVIYEESGAGTITYTGMQVTTLSTVLAQPAQLPTVAGAPWSIGCPVSVGQIVVTGSYSYTQPCQEYDGMTGKTVGEPIPATGSGTFTQTVSGAVITWTLQYDPTTSSVSLAGVSVVPVPTMAVTEASTGSGFLAFFQNLLDGPEVEALQGGMVDVLQNSVFTQALVAEFNAALAQSSTGTNE